MQSLATLGLASLTPQVLRFLASRGITSVEEFLVHDLYMLVAVAEFHQGLEEIKQAVADILSFLETHQVQWYNGVDLFNSFQKEVHFIPTGCESIDSLLLGGLKYGTITELVGPVSCGKTQMCMQTASLAVLGGDTVAYVDTCNSFSSIRISEMMNGHSQSFSKVQDLGHALKNIYCYRIFDIFSFLTFLHQIHSNLNCDNKETNLKSRLQNLRLIVVDSISSLISPVLSNNHVEGHALMMRAGQLLKRIAIENHLCILITNHTVAGEDGLPKPALGESWKTVSHVRLFLSREHPNDVCNISLIKHTSTVCMKPATFLIDHNGLHPLL